MMQPFMNPNYFMQYPQYSQQSNPYMQRMENLQQFQQAINQPIQTTQISGTSQFTPLGKIVESVDMVKATDIPMDGNIYYFPKADGTEIYGKQWLQNGTTHISVFKPILEETPSNSTLIENESAYNAFTQVLEGIQSDIKSLTDKVDKLSKPTRSKKEASDDE